MYRKGPPGEQPAPRILWRPWMGRVGIVLGCVAAPALGSVVSWATHCGPGIPLLWFVGVFLGGLVLLKDGPRTRWAALSLCWWPVWLAVFLPYTVVSGIGFGVRWLFRWITRGQT